jgi:hypothetical protein
MTQLEIYNAALASLGHDQTVAALTDTTPEANWCNRFYDQGRKMMLRLTNPTFASMYEELSDVETSDIPGWLYQWPRPGDLVSIISVTDDAGDPAQFRLLNDKIITNVDAGGVEYIFDETDTDAFDPLFTQALIARLAADIAVPLTGKADLRRIMEQACASAMSDFRTRDANDGREVGDPADANYYVTSRA